MEYQSETTSVTGFVQQLAVSYVTRGYFRYVTGEIPKRKDPRVVDRRIIEKYGLENGDTPEARKSARARRKASGLANVQYIRFRQFFVLVATDGEHPVFAQEANVHDVRLGRPIKFGGYAISHSGGRVHVRIEWDRFQNLRARWLDLAVHRRKEWFEERFRRLPFEPYAPIVQQLFGLLEKINERRKLAQFEKIPSSCIRVYFRKVHPFAPVIAACEAHTLEQGAAAASRLRAGDKLRSAA
jgi:hypothetical protein